MEVLSFDICLGPNMDILTREGKLTCFLAHCCEAHKCHVFVLVPEWPFHNFFGLSIQACACSPELLNVVFVSPLRCAVAG